MTEDSETDKPNGSNMSAEVLLSIFSHFELPAPEVIGRERWEHLKRENVFEQEVAPTFDLSPDENYYLKLQTNDKEWATRIKTLSSLVRCSKRFHEIATPLLYNMYPGQRIADIKCFSRTLTEQPNKRDLVKRMVLDPFRATINNRLILPNNPYRDGHQCIKRLGLSHQLIDSLQQFAEAGMEDGQVALLLFLCPKLQVLDLSASMDFRLGTVYMLLIELRKERPNTLFRADGTASILDDDMSLPLRNLQELSTRYADSNHIAGTKIHDNLIRLPTIKKLTLYRFCNEARVLGQSPQLEDLTLWRCTFNMSTILLEKLSNLRNLKIVFAGVMCSMGTVHIQHDTTLSFKALSNALQKHCPNLETLRLDTRELLYHTKTRQLDDLDVSQLPNLKELAVEAQVLWGSHVTEGDTAKTPPRSLQDILPLSLRKLTVLIYHQTSRLFERRWDQVRDRDLMLPECLRYAKSAPPSLREIHLDLPWTDIEHGLEHDELEDFRWTYESPEEIGWTLEGVLEDEDVARASPVAGSMTERDELLYLCRSFRRWEPSEDGEGWYTMVLRKIK